MARSDLTDIVKRHSWEIALNGLGEYPKAWSITGAVVDTAPANDNTPAANRPRRLIPT